MKRALFWLGGMALLAATLLDTVSVIGRNAGFAIHGVIELIQAAVLVAGGIALVMATLAGAHARVHLVLDRLTMQHKVTAERAAALLTALLFAAMLAGSAWLAVELWGAHETSELLGVPWRWMRLFANLCLLGAVAVLLRQAFQRRG
jgi:TRAP-type transport system small permease protein